MEARYNDKRLWVSHQGRMLEAEFIEECAGIRFYEDPFYGDDTGLWAVHANVAVGTDYFEVPDAEEIGDPAEFMECYA
jgi:hypothetical protein